MLKSKSVNKRVAVVSETGLPPLKRAHTRGRVGLAQGLEKEKY
jgi:hypothetical protein